MKKHLFILLALVALLIILLTIIINPPKAIPEDVPPVIATSTDEVVPDVIVTPGSKKVVAALRERIAYNDILIEPSAIVEDSRCPKSVQCIQAGRAVVTLNIYSLEGEHITSKDVEEGTSFYAGSTKITLEKVTPYPSVTGKMSESGYRFELLLEVVE